MGASPRMRSGGTGRQPSKTPKTPKTPKNQETKDIQDPNDSPNTEDNHLNYAHLIPRARALGGSGGALARAERPRD